MAWVTANSISENMDGLDTTVASDKALLEGNGVDSQRDTPNVIDDTPEGTRDGDGHHSARRISGAWKRECIGMWCRDQWKF